MPAPKVYPRSLIHTPFDDCDVGEQSAAVPPTPQSSRGSLTGGPASDWSKGSAEEHEHSDVGSEGMVEEDLHEGMGAPHLKKQSPSKKIGAKRPEHTYGKCPKKSKKSPNE